VPNPSGSYLYRTTHCPPSQALPHVRITSADAARGTAGHGHLERVPKMGVDASLAQAPIEYRDLCENIDLDGLPLGPECKQEVTYRFDLHTGRAELIGCSLSRRYGERNDRYVYGTIDVDEPGAVADYKFDGYESNTEPAESNHQLLFAALCKARVEGLSEVRGRLIHFRPDGSHWQESAAHDAFALDAFEQELRSTIRRVREAEALVARGETPSVSRGDWCRYCPAAASCPAVVSLIRAVALEPAKTADEIRAALTPATARAAYLRLQEIKAALNPVSSALYLYASEFPIDLGDGRVYGPVETRRETIDARKARAVLAEKYGPEVAEAACDFTTSKTAIARALKDVAKAAKASGQKVTQKALNEETLAALAEAGAVEATTKRAVRRHRVKDGQVIDLESED